MTTPAFFDTVERLFHDWKYDHPRILYALIRSFKPQHVLEFGTYRGYSACYMARALQENNAGHLTCVDNFSLRDHEPRYGDALRHLENNLTFCGVRDFVTILAGDSEKVKLPSQVDFCYVDGWHSFTVTLFDFTQAAARGAQCICLDDTRNCVGPRLVLHRVREVFGKEWDVVDLPGDNGLGVCVRKRPPERLTYSQELPLPNPGDNITDLTDEQLLEYFTRVAKVTGVDYSPLIG